MRVVVTAEGAGMDAPASSVFGRCPAYVFVDTESMEAEPTENPAMSSSSGAGIQAAQFVVERGAEAVITGNVGPNAYSVFQASQVPVYLLEGGTVRDAVEAFKEGDLRQAGGATSAAHAGLGRHGAAALGARRGQEQRARAPEGERVSPAWSRRQEEIAELQEMAAELRKQLAEVVDRLDQLEKEA